jgi:hypothetical protein
VQRQTAYLLHKNSKREEEEAGMLATIFGWPKEATLEDRKLNARWLIDQSGVKDENMTMTFTDKKRKTLKLRTASLQQPRVARPIKPALK